METRGHLLLSLTQTRPAFASLHSSEVGLRQVHSVGLSLIPSQTKLASESQGSQSWVEEWPGG